METTLNTLRAGQGGKILSLRLDEAMCRRLVDFGLIEGTQVLCLRRSPAGSPILFRVRGTMLALRAADSGKIRVKICE